MTAPKSTTASGRARRACLRRGLAHYNKLDRGGHFAAWEQPQLFSNEMRTAFKSLRSDVAKSAA